jgi:hypothetical protein
MVYDGYFINLKNFNKMIDVKINSMGYNKGKLA